MYGAQVHHRSRGVSSSASRIELADNQTVRRT
jgi:hypothetical protein